MHTLKVEISDDNIQEYKFKTLAKAKAAAKHWGKYFFTIIDDDDDGVVVDINKPVTSSAAAKAQKNFYEKRKKSKFPTVWLTDEEFELWEQVVAHHGGTKHDATVECIKAYLGIE